MSKPRMKHLSIRVPDSAMKKLARIAKKVTPAGNEPSKALAVRNLIEKEKA